MVELEIYEIKKGLIKYYKGNHTVLYLCKGDEIDIDDERYIIVSRVLIKNDWRGKERLMVNVKKLESWETEENMTNETGKL